MSILSASARPLALAALLSLSADHSANAVTESHGKPLRGLTTVPVQKLVERPSDYDGKTLRTEGTVSAVCTAKGCWMELLEGEKKIRVTFKDYGFFVPKDIVGAKVAMEGVFKVETIPEATAKHYAAETPGGKPDLIVGDQKELSFVATGVELTRK